MCIRDRVEAVQAGILTAGFVEIIHIPQNHLLLDTNVEIFRKLRCIGCFARFEIVPNIKAHSLSLIHI